MQALAAAAACPIEADVVRAGTDETALRPACTGFDQSIGRPYDEATVLRVTLWYERNSQRASRRPRVV